MNAQLDPTIMNARAAWTANLKRGQLPNAANALPKPDLKKDLKVAGPRLPEPQGDDDKGDSPKRKLPWLSLGPEKAATLKEATSLKASGLDGQGGVDDWAQAYLRHYQKEHPEELKKERARPVLLPIQEQPGTGHPGPCLQPPPCNLTWPCPTG
jgi:hypothetical protein